MMTSHSPVHARRSFARVACLAALACLLIAWACSRPPDAAGTGPRPVKIGLAYIGPHALIDQIVDGFKRGVAETMGSRGFEIVEKHANNDKTQISSVVNATVAAQVDVLATITTPVSQDALKNKPQGLPLVFVGITDPVGAGLVQSLEQPAKSTGVSDRAPLARTLEMIRRIAPSVKKVGLPYSPDEQPAVYSRREVEQLAPGFGLTIDARPVTNRDELPSLLTSLARSNDALLVGADNGMFEAAALVSKIALDHRIPFFAADTSSIQAGAVAGVTIDYRQVGVAGGKLAARVAKGEAAGGIPVEVMTDGVLELNKRSLAALKLAPDQSVLQAAKTVY